MVPTVGAIRHLGEASQRRRARADNQGTGHNWQPDWSPDGKYIAYRSESDEGGLFIIPALGGAGLQRKIASTGYYPRWSPDGSQILFQTNQTVDYNRFNVVSLDGSQPHEVLTEFFAKHQLSTKSAAWHPDGKRITIWAWGRGLLHLLDRSHSRRRRDQVGN